MRTSTGGRIGLILAIVLGSSHQATPAVGGSWTGQESGGAIFLIDYSNDQTLIRQSLPTDIGVGIIYNPSMSAGFPGVTDGDPTTYYNLNPNDFSLSINCGPGFRSTSAIAMTVTAPADGGLDTITFQARGVPKIPNETMIGPSLPSEAMVTLYAPCGTLSSPTEWPTLLDAFADYSADHPGGFWSFTPGEGYLGGVGGTLGAVPEPGSLTSMATGMTIALAVLAVRWNRRRRSKRS